MAVKTFELQDSSSNIYYPHTRSDVVFLEDGTTKLSTSLSESMNILTPSGGSTENAILLNIPTLTNNKKYSFKATSASTGNVTINGKVFKKSDGTQIGSGGVKINKVYDFYYDSTNDCVFILAKAEGNATDADVLAGKIYSNGDDIGRVGTIPINGALNETLPINGTYTIPSGYTTGGTVTQSITTKATQTYTPSTVNQTISANQYLTGIQTILGDANLISSNIISGKSIFGVAGAATKLNVVTGIATINNVGTNDDYFQINLPFMPKAFFATGGTGNTWSYSIQAIREEGITSYYLYQSGQYRLIACSISGNIYTFPCYGLTNVTTVSWKAYTW